MLRWWKRNEGFEWREYVRTTILVRRNKRREKVEEAKKAAVAGLKQAGKAGAEASASGFSKAWQGARAGAAGLVRMSSKGLAALGSAPVRTGHLLLPALAPVGRAISRSTLQGPIVAIGAIGIIAAAARCFTSGFDTETLIAAGLGLAGLSVGLLPVLTGYTAPPFWLATLSGRLPRWPTVSPGVIGVVILAAVAGAGTLALTRFLPASSPGSLLGGLPLAASKPIEGRATPLGGDTMKVGNVIVRLAGIETPEGDQRCPGPGKKTGRCGEAAMEALGRLVRGKLVTCTLSGSDETGRSLASCKTEGNDIAAALVKQGVVFAAQGMFARYASLEAEARDAKAGLWRSDIKRPAEWRAKRWEEAKRSAPDGCPIKGAVGTDGKVYVLPWSREYDRVKVRAGRGERWFCSEQDARAAGWRLAEKS